MTAQPWPVADASVLAPVPEHEDLRKVLRDLLAAHADHEAVRRAADGPDGYSTELWTLLNDEMNVGSLAVPEARGGLGFGLGELAVVLEEAGRALLPEPLLTSAVLGVAAVLAAPVGDVPDRIVRDVIGGRLVATVAIRHRVAGDLSVSESDGWLSVTGTIDRVLLGATADVVVVRGGVVGGESIYLVDLRGEVAERTPLEVLDLTRRQARVQVSGAPAYLVAGPEQADAVCARLATLARVALAAEQVGMIEAMLDLLRTYAGQRHQFGRPLASFQVIKHRLADILVDLERARSAARYAAAAFDQDPATAVLPSAVAGAICTDAVIRVAHECVQLHGGIGFTWEHPAHYYLRRALGDEAVFGSAAAHRALVADLLGL
ncbi:acyl-CoA dehydrogenase family protein [Nocardioides pocheonensis]|uniref:Acyl-CoA dehydrogenase n=1 Tax=Nocardioides pocheonensis TaxID=661485 RepID=A0A3N0GZ80_9ACTN|nr:acyl-CoA dehydrogenase family protein [Nocardioides pocheonensis]RNM17418.1 acyl-CoA dehydrogenase [Nocardioides pocheonensis]